VDSSYTYPALRTLHTIAVKLALVFNTYPTGFPFLRLTERVPVHVGAFLARAIPVFRFAVTVLIRSKALIIRGTFIIFLSFTPRFTLTSNTFLIRKRAIALLFTFLYPRNTPIAADAGTLAKIIVAIVTHAKSYTSS